MSGLNSDERLRRAAAIINRAVNNGLTEILVGRCTDGGRAINQLEPGWEKTLIGLPKELFQFWKQYLQPRGGYRVKFQIADWPNGMLATSASSWPVVGAIKRITHDEG
jgi:hypothetical protein